MRLESALIASSPSCDWLMPDLRYSSGLLLEMFLLVCQLTSAQLSARKLAFSERPPQSTRIEREKGGGTRVGEAKPATPCHRQRCPSLPLQEREPGFRGRNVAGFWPASRQKLVGVRDRICDSSKIGAATASKGRPSRSESRSAKKS